eukprot:jgi/Galph1/3765/GphlegSOOS_G2431.1
MEPPFTVTRRRVVFRQGKTREKALQESLSDRISADVQPSSSSAANINPSKYTYRCNKDNSSTSSSSTSSTVENTEILTSRASHTSLSEDPSLEILPSLLSLKEEEDKDSVQVVAKSFHGAHEPFQWKTSYISIPSSSEPSSLESILYSSQKRSRDFEKIGRCNQETGDSLTLMRRHCLEHSKMTKNKRPKVQTATEFGEESREDNCERCQMMTRKMYSWMVAIRRAILSASTLPFDPRYHYISYHIDKRGIVYCDTNESNEPLIRFLPVENSKEQAPRKRARIAENKVGN